MNSMAVVALGGNMDPDTIRLLLNQDKERREKLEKVIVNVGKNAVTGYRYFKGAPKVIDATTGKEIEPEDARYSGLMAKYRQEEDVKFAMFENFVNSIVDLAVEFAKPSAFEAELLARMMQGRKDTRLSADSARFTG